MRNPNFEAALKDWLENKGGTQQELINGTGLKQGTVQAICRFKSGGSPKTWRPIGEYIAGSLEAFLARGRAIRESDNKSSPQNKVIDLKHDDIIRQFRDKLTAMAVNRALLTIERLDPAAFIELAQRIIGKASLMENGHKYNEVNETACVAEKKNRYGSR